MKKLTPYSWNFISTIFNQLITFVISIILARLLVPEDFGLAAMIIAITGFFSLIADFGIGNAIIYYDNLTQSKLSSIFWFNLILGLILTTTVFLLSNYISIFYKADITKLVQISSFQFLFSTTTIISKSLIVKKMQFKTSTVINAIAVIISSTLGILFAYYNYGVYSLIIKNISSAALLFLLYSYFGKFTPTLQFNYNEIKLFIKYGIELFLSNALAYWTSNTDKLIIGKYIGAESLGLYSRGYNLFLLPLNFMTGTFSQVLIADLSSKKEDITYVKKKFLEITDMLTFILFPIYIILFLQSTEMIVFLYGEKWAATGFYLKYLSLTGSILSTTTLLGVPFIITNKLKLMFKLGLLVELTTIISLLIGLYFGMKGILFGFCISQFILIFPKYYFSLTIINIKIIEYIKYLIPNIFLLLFFITLLISFNYLFHFVGYNYNRNLILFVKLGLSVMAYMVFGIIFKNKNAILLVNKIKNNLTK